MVYFQYFSRNISEYEHFAKKTKYPFNAEITIGKSLWGSNKING